jgi:hypothetical protein
VNLVATAGDGQIAIRTTATTTPTRNGMMANPPLELL